ncbi:MAG: hypothetical protein A4E19_13570 [Nitrospira sp. SG-bin1]|nr:MAG: hypothetical protein A4E19_13570 [Nitrospira sp. SG-bin1]
MPASLILFVPGMAVIGSSGLKERLPKPLSTKRTDQKGQLLEELALCFLERVNVVLRQDWRHALDHWMVLLTSLEGALSPALLYAVTTK